MIEIEFRGICVDKGELQGKLVYGDLVVISKKTFIHPKCNSTEVIDRRFAKLLVVHEIDPETAEQFTGKHDMKRTEVFPEGQKIFVGDIIQHASRVAVIRFGDFAESASYKSLCIGFYPEFTKDDDILRHDLGWWLQEAGCEVIGSIRMNPELMAVNV